MFHLAGDLQEETAHLHFTQEPRSREAAFTLKGRGPGKRFTPCLGCEFVTGDPRPVYYFKFVTNSERGQRQMGHVKVSGRFRSRGAILDAGKRPVKPLEVGGRGAYPK